MRHSVGLIFFLLVQSALAQDFTNGKFDVKPSWENAEVFVPGRLLNTNVRELAKMEPMDVVLYLHGCAGIKEDEQQWGGFLNGLGLVVVAPDSLSIKGRRMNCDPKANATNVGHHSREEIGRIRVTELVYAVNQLKDLPNIRRIFFMGFSEGAAIVLAGFPMHEKDGSRVPAISRPISGVISVASFCNGPVRVPNDIPLLTINFEADPYFPGASNAMCAEKTSSRKGVTNVVLKGHGHEAGMDRIARETVRDFIGALRGK